MDRPISFITTQVDTDENGSNTSDKKWRVLYYGNSFSSSEPKKHPIMDNFEILREKNEELERRMEMLEKQVDKLTSKIWF